MFVHLRETVFYYTVVRCRRLRNRTDARRFVSYYFQKKNVESFMTRLKIGQFRSGLQEIKPKPKPELKRTGMTVNRTRTET